MGNSLLAAEVAGTGVVAVEMQRNGIIHPTGIYQALLMIVLGSQQ